ncbi:MAG: DNA polymerase III subunit alpha [Bacteroidia bacterium]|nr:DNA polymerase III subunit alpha [Bacteroidia bacterium]
MYLNCHTYYSFRYGTFSEEELLRLAQQNNIRALALTDINNTSACLNFIRLAPSYNVRPILGIDFRNDGKQQFVGIAKNNEGFLELNSFLSQYLHSKQPIPDQAPEFQDAYIVYPFEVLLRMDKQDFLPNELIGISIKDVNKLRFNTLINKKDRLVALHSVTFRNKVDFNSHRLLRAVDKGTLLSKLSIDDQAEATDLMLSEEQLKGYYKDVPFVINNTERLVERCTIQFDFSKNRKHQNRKTFTGSPEGDRLQLQQLCKEGLPRRYKKITPEIRARIDKELKLIQEMDFMSFFLINHDIISYAKHKNYFHVGRGSGANSIVAYLLGITDVDPIDLDLYFERFMNLYRTNPPDFDIDFSSRDRDDVTRYIFERFGTQGQVALLATYNTFKHSAAVRELGKVFGLPKHEIDKLSSARFSARDLDQLSSLVIKYAQRIMGFPNHLSVHAGGILISEKPIHYFTATDLPPKGFPTTHFDMVIAEDVGLYKYDILGQRGLGKIKDTLGIIKKNRPQAPDIDIHNVQPLLTDKKINYMVSQAKCIGCFYVESPAMRMLLKKLKVDSYLGLVAASSIIRPGVSKSGMMREYILRHKDPERRKLAHPVMQSIMPETYGVMVYQEDVIKVAHYYAGLDLGEADVLRRGMSGKFRSREEFARVKQKFIDNCRAKGEPEQVIQEIWKQTESFAGYAFAKGHSASYAVESYQSLFLKTYYPLEYMVAVINNGGGYYRVETYVHEARMHGATINAPCVNKSEGQTTIYSKDIYLGFQHLSGLETRTIRQLLEQRYGHGNYRSLDDFLERTNTSIEQLDILIRIGAFRFTGRDKRTLLWQAHFKTSKQPKRLVQQRLFHEKPKHFNLPEFNVTTLENAFDEIELLGFPLCSPFLLLKEDTGGNYLAAHFKEFVNKKLSLIGYLVSVKNTSTHKGDHMYFGTFLDREGQWVDTVHFPPVAKKFPFRGRGVYFLTGKVINEFGFLSLEVNSMRKCDYIEDPRFVENVSN